MKFGRQIERAIIKLCWMDKVGVKDEKLGERIRKEEKGKKVR
jgi:hypothetical protein